MGTAASTAARSRLRTDSSLSSAPYRSRAATEASTVSFVGCSHQFQNIPPPQRERFQYQFSFADSSGIAEESAEWQERVIQNARKISAEWEESATEKADDDQ